MNFNSNTVQDEFYELAAWRQNDDPLGWQLDPVEVPAKELYFNDVHPLLSLDNIISIAPDFSLTAVDQAQINNMFTEWLEAKTKASIVKAIQTWLETKVIKRTARNLLEDNADLFKASGNVNEYDTNNGKTVGFEIIPPVSRSINLTIDKIGLQLETDQLVNVRVFQSGKTEFFLEKDITTASSGGVHWESVDWVLPGGHSYWLVYNQTGMTDRSINGVRDYNFHVSGLESFPTGRFYCVKGIQHSEGTANLWDLRKNSYVLDTNFGLNLKCSVRCDYTSFLVDQKDMFSELVRLQVGMDMLKSILFNPQARENRNNANVNWQQITYEMDGDTQGDNSFSMTGQFKRSLNAIQFDSSGVDQLCLPCKKRGVRWTKQ